jgi:hypothetical protein
MFMKKLSLASFIFSLVMTISPAQIFAQIPTHTSSCEELRVVSGNNNFAPSTVTFRAQGKDSDGTIQAYHFYFGDGKEEETTNPNIQHRFESSGTFTARVDIKDSLGTWKTSTTCSTIFSLLTSPLESQKSDCSNVFITDGNYSPAPVNAKFLVTGYDNKSGIKRYKIDFGNSQVKESDSGRFDLTFIEPGTYTVKGYIQDSKNNWKGGTAGCQQSLYVEGKPLTTQPSTGTPTLFTAVGVVTGLALFFILSSKKSKLI